MIATGVLAAALAWASDPVAVLTEMQARQGKVEVKPAGADWQPQAAAPLRAGDQVRAVGDARAVLVFTGGRGTGRHVGQLAVRHPGQTAEGTSDRARTVLGNVTSFLIGQQREVVPVPVGAERAPSRRSSSPRATRGAASSLTFEWAGRPPEIPRAPARAAGRRGVGAERPRAAAAAVSGGAPAWTAGTRYTWELQTQEHGAQSASFEIASAADATRVRDSLALLTPSTAQAYPPATLALMRAGLLFQETLYADARRELLTAIAAAPEEPTLRLLLGHVYDRTGLTQLAATEFDEAEALTAPRN